MRKTPEQLQIERIVKEAIAPLEARIKILEGDGWKIGDKFDLDGQEFEVINLIGKNLYYEIDHIAYTCLKTEAIKISGSHN